MSRIVILGGMGPQASIVLHTKIITLASKHGAINNNDFPEIVHFSAPIHDFIDDGDQQKSIDDLKNVLSGFEFREDDKVVLACNTMHLLQNEIESHCKTKLTSLIDEVSFFCSRQKLDIVGLIASPTTIKSKLYDKPLQRLGCRVINPSRAETARLEEAIRNVIAGGDIGQSKAIAMPAVERMLSEGAEMIILGCTELSVCFENSQSRLIDPLQLVTTKLVNTSLK